jgi:hypothetical protein
MKITPVKFFDPSVQVGFFAGAAEFEPTIAMQHCRKTTRPGA